MAGLIGAISCHMHKELIPPHFDASEVFTRWFWRVGWGLMAIHLIANWFGWRVLCE
jgi:hypothetical protein